MWLKFEPLGLKSFTPREMAAKGVEPIGHALPAPQEWFFHNGAMLSMTFGPVGYHEHLSHPVPPRTMTFSSHNQQGRRPYSCSEESAAWKY